MALRRSEIEMTMRHLANIVREHVKSALDPIIKEVAEIRARAPIRGEKGEPGERGNDGRDGKDADTECIAALEHEIAELKRLIAELVSREPARGEKGEPGRDAEPITEDRLATAVAKYLEANPPKPGDPGKDAPPVTLSQITLAVAGYFKENPPPTGKDGEPGKPGESIKGDEGRGIKAALIDSDGNLVLTFTDGNVQTVGRVKGDRGEPGETPKDGLDGKDGLGFDDMTAELEDDGRVLCLRWVRGDQRKEVRLTTGMSIYRGVFKEGPTYERGDLVTWGGSVWHCNSETAEKPGDGSKGWTLAVKKGRDGRDGKDGEKGERGAPGKDGRDRY